MQTVRVRAKVIQDDSGVFTEIPVLLDANKKDGLLLKILVKRLPTLQLVDYKHLYNF